MCKVTPKETKKHAHEEYEMRDSDYGLRRASGRQSPADCASASSLTVARKAVFTLIR